MKNRLRLFLLLACSLVSYGAVSLEPSGIKESEANGWTGPVEICTTGVGGPKAMLLKLDNDKKVVTISKTINFSKTTSQAQQLLKVRFVYKTQDTQDNDIVIRLLNRYDYRRDAEYPCNKRIYDTLSPSSEWKEFTTQAFIDPNIETVTLFVDIANDRGKGQIWFDKIEINVLDRGGYFEFVNGVTSDLLRSGVVIPVFAHETGLIRFKVSDANCVNSGNVNVYDEADNLVSKIAISKNKSLIPIRLANRGFYRITSEILYDDGIREDKEIHATVVGPMLPEKTRKSSPFGLTFSDSISIAAGSGWSRPFHGFAGEEYRLAAENNFPAPKKLPINRGLNHIYCFWPQPLWLQDKKIQSEMAVNPFIMYPIADHDFYSKLLNYAMDEIDEKVSFVEVSNEPESYWRGSLQELVDYHRDIGKIVKSRNPKAQIVGPSYCTIDIAQINRVVDLGIADCLDGLAVHDYVHGSAPEEEFIQKIRDLKKYLNSIKKSEMPLYITEYGWTTMAGGWQKEVSNLKQAQYLSRSMILLSAENIAAMFPFCLWWAVPVDASSTFGYTMLDWELHPKLSYSAYANITRCLAETEKPGKVLEMCPDNYLALFKKGSNTIVAAWTKEAKSQSFVPGTYIWARNMVGRPVELRSNMIETGPNPVFIEVKGLDLYESVQSSEKKIALSGRKLTLPWKIEWADSRFSCNGNELRIPANIELGSYLVLGKDKNVWQYQMIQVAECMNIVSRELEWPVDSNMPQINVAVRSNLLVDVNSEVTLVPENMAPAKKNIIIKKNAITTTNLELQNFKSGKRYKGSIKIQAFEPELQMAELFNFTLVSCEAIDSNKLDWSKIKSFDFSEWAHMVNSGDNKWPDASECSGSMQMAYSDAGLHLRVIVTDDVHVQNKQANEIWEDDCMQVAFDFDAALPWKANDLFGFQGHSRIFEYGFALGKSVMAWRWISYCQDLPSGIAVDNSIAKITRDGVKTTYEIVFPWEMLGLKERPPMGSKIGFALAINDRDSENEKHVITLFDGIANKKDPSNYGAVWLR